MRELIPYKLGYPLRQEVFSSWWHGKMPTAPVTWSHRNITSTTDNAAGDITLTFAQAYRATPAAMVGTNFLDSGQVALALGGSTITEASARFVIIGDFSGTLTESEKTSIAFVGEL